MVYISGSWVVFQIADVYLLLYIKLLHLYQTNCFYITKLIFLA